MSAKDISPEVQAAILEIAMTPSTDSILEPWDEGLNRINKARDAIVQDLVKRKLGDGILDRVVEQFYSLANAYVVFQVARHDLWKVVRGLYQPLMDKEDVDDR